MAERILIIDDDEKIRQLISIYLQNEGFDTVQARNAMEGIGILNSDQIDLVLLDIMMPDMDGIEACLKIRENLNMPIIMVSAKSEDMDKIHGITSGADDYLTKPFNPMELIVRVKSQLRRYKKYNKAQAEKTNLIEIGDLIINTDTRQVWATGREVRLTPKEFDILELLARNRGIVLSISKIYETVWGEDFFKSDNTVMVHITKIREKIENNPKDQYILKPSGEWATRYEPRSLKE